MHNAVVVEVCDGGQYGADEVGGIGFVVASFATNAVEKFAAESEFDDEVQVVHGLKIVDESQYVLVTH